MYNYLTFFFEQLIGSNDEILDVAPLGNESSRSLAVAVNSCDIYLFPWQKKKIINDDNSEQDKIELGVCCKRLKGHTDTVLCLVSYKNILVSSSKVSYYLITNLIFIKMYFFFFLRIIVLEYGLIVM